MEKNGQQYLWDTKRIKYLWVYEWRRSNKNVLVNETQFVWRKNMIAKEKRYDWNVLLCFKHWQFSVFFFLIQGPEIYTASGLFICYLCIMEQIMVNNGQWNGRRNYNNGCSSWHWIWCWSYSLDEVKRHHKKLKQLNPRETVITFFNNNKKNL